MANDRFTARIQSDLQALGLWLAKATHAFLDSPLDFRMRRLHKRDGRPALMPLAAAAMALALPLLAPAAVAATQETLFAFATYTRGPQRTGANPSGTLLRDAIGALYGTTFLGSAPYEQGTVFQLRPPASGQRTWTYSVLYNFTGGKDGKLPNADLVMDGRGALYGTTTTWSGSFQQGLVFKLMPPAPGTTAWTQTVLHAFNYYWGAPFSDGSAPGAGLIMDGNGALYGTTIGGGYGYGATLGGVKLVPPAQGYGTVFKLVPPAPGTADWQETVLYRFAGGADGQNPAAALTLDAATGALYGTTLYGGGGTHQDAWGNVVGDGTVFKLSPPGPGQTAWTKTTLYRFRGGADGGLPYGKLLLDASGTLYGVTYQGGTGGGTDSLGHLIGSGTVYKLTPPGPGQTGWSQSVLHSFTGPEGAFPQGGVIADAAGNLYGTASAGGTLGYGVVFQLSPPAPGQIGWSETVLYNFHVSTSGDSPVGELVGGPGGHLFGVTWQGGAGLGGTVFEVTP